MSVSEFKARWSKDRGGVTLMKWVLNITFILVLVLIGFVFLMVWVPEIPPD